jgi:DNA primase
LGDWTYEKSIFALGTLGFDKIQLSKLSPSKNDVMLSCPFHGRDSNPSFHINLQDGRAHCFGCGEGPHLGKIYKERTGHNIEDDMGIKSSTFYNPLKRTAVSLSWEDPPDVEFKIDDLESVPLDKSRTALEYVTERKASVKALSAMGARYCVSGGTIRNNKKMSFADRLIVPIYEYNKGKRSLLSIEGRACHPPKPGFEASYKKVLYPSGSSMNTLFEWQQLDTKRTLYVVEGLMDLAVLREDEFFANSTAVFGAAITQRQFYLLNKFDDVFYLQDCDNAGRKTVDDLGKKMLKPFRALNDIALNIMKREGFKDMGDVVKTGHTISGLRERRFFEQCSKIIPSA